jgi:hypothetical protein
VRSFDGKPRGEESRDTVLLISARRKVTGIHHLITYYGLQYFDKLIGGVKLRKEYQVYGEKIWSAVHQFYTVNAIMWTPTASVDIDNCRLCVHGLL